MSDANSGNNESVNDGIFSAVAEANHETYAAQGRLDKAASDPAATGQTGGGTPTKQKPTKTEDDEESEGDNAEGLDTQDFSRELPDSESEEEIDESTTSTTEPSQTNTETKTEVEEDWTQSLPPAPGEFTLEAPKPDEEGLIDPTKYGEYLMAKVRHDSAVEKYNDKLIDTVTATVEKILPEIKENEAFRVALENTFISTGDGNKTVDLAKNFRASLDKLAGESKAAGAQNAKTSITVQKNATIEAKGATKKKAAPSRDSNLQKRLAKGDDSAFAELFDDWQESGKI